MVRLIAVAATVWLTACSVSVSGDAENDAGNYEAGNHENSTSSSCASMAGGGTRAEFFTTCLDCTVSQPELAIDGNPLTFATMSMPNGAVGLVALRATAQSGVVYPIGSQAGATYAFDDNAEERLMVTQIETYLLGVPTEPTWSPTITIIGSHDTERRQMSIGAVAVFDAVEFQVIRSSAERAANIRVYDFCAG